MHRVVVITSRLESTDADPWASVAPTLASAVAHGAAEVVVAWEGPHPPSTSPAVPAHPVLRFVERPPLLSRSEALWWVADQLGGDVVVLADDAVLCPDSLARLQADVEVIRPVAGAGLGVVAARSNSAPLPQDVRFANGTEYRVGTGFDQEQQIMEVDRCAWGLAFLSTAVFAATTPPWHDDLADEVVCLDLVDRGFRHFISRAYVHRAPAARSTTWGRTPTEVDGQGAHLLAFLRPDLLDRWRPPPTGAPAPTAADERADPEAALQAWRAQPDSHARRFGLARCYRAVGRSAEAAAALGDFDPDRLTVDELRFAAELARTLGDWDTAIALYRHHPDLAPEADALSAMLAQAATWPFR